MLSVHCDTFEQQLALKMGALVEFLLFSCKRLSAVYFRIRSICFMSVHFRCQFIVSFNRVPTDQGKQGIQGKF